MIRSDSIPSEIVLTVLSGEEKGRIIVLSAPSPQVVGRGENADVKLSPDDPCMNRRHIQIEKVRWWMADVSHRGSANQPP